MIPVEELERIIKLYPRLIYAQEKGRQLVRGTFEFCALYDAIGDRFILNPSTSDSALEDRIIQDSYEIEVEFFSGSPLRFPDVREVGGRIQKVIEKFDIKDIRDLHVNKNLNNAICLCPKPEFYVRYPNGLDLFDFFNALVLPYFYGLTYFEKHGEWPRGTYGHGDVGIFEFYFEHRNAANANLIKSCIENLSESLSKEYLQRKGEAKGHWECVCGSKKKMRDCHAKTLGGLRALREDIRNKSINLNLK